MGHSPYIFFSVLHILYYALNDFKPAVLANNPNINLCLLAQSEGLLPDKEQREDCKPEKF